MRSRSLFVAIVLLLCASALSAQTRNVGGTPIMPLSEVKPGMCGYGLSAWRGNAVERFSFRVVTIERTGQEFYPEITIETFPDNSFQTIPGLVIAGMSGSPLYINDRLVAVVARALTFPKDGKAFAIPIEILLDLYPTVLDKPNPTLEPSTPSTWSAGEPYIYCSVWGDVGRCSGATTTLFDASRNLLYAQGHVTSDWGEGENDSEKQPIDVGSATLPVWHAKATGRILTLDTSMMLSSEMGPIVGTIVWNGEYGHIIRTDRTPKFVPVTVVIPDVLAKPAIFRFNVAYSKSMIVDIVRSVKNLAKVHYGNNRSALVRLNVRLYDRAEPVVVQDTFLNYADQGANNVLVNLLNRLLEEPSTRLGIDGLDFTLLPGDGVMFTTTGVTASRDTTASTISVTLNVQRRTDGRGFARSFIAKTTPELVSKEFYIVSGAWVQRTVLHRSEINTALDEVAKVQDGTALFLIATNDVEEPDTTAPSGWSAKRTVVTILGQLTDDSTRMYVPADDIYKIAAETKEEAKADSAESSEGK